ncbi:Gfo/Idh/MocA family protein [Streptacidiphilus rugosus]|uniref:Gfo/Idh/MocA family protein n=1 Tax=Streptacidiphilus rugosus TaxID=405783 RepID=UPI001E60E14F|nr:Gfo/Idh/MocA family oxidoreductase [Streptacidiphilus rugosus]
MRPIRWGILATGAIAGDFTEDLALVPGAEVFAVASRSQSSADAFAARHGIPHAYGSWEAMARDERIDVVYVATPHSAHHDAASLCLDAGRAVLCEKPVTMNAAEARALVELARKRGVFLMEAMWMRCNPAIRKVVSLVADGALGRLRTVQADFGIAGPFDPGHRLRDPALGGGALLDLGVYPVSLAHLLLGAPDQVRAWSTRTPEGVDANTGLLLGYDGGLDDGALAALSCGIVAGTPCRASIVGELGRIELPPVFFRPDHFTLFRGEEDAVGERFDVPYTGRGFVHEAEEVMRCLREGLTESPLMPWQASVEVMEILDEARRAASVS